MDDDATRTRLAAVDTPALSDAMDRRSETAMAIELDTGAPVSAVLGGDYDTMLLPDEPDTGARP
ncbi:MAG: hypothetical protein AAGD18_25635 [Actinomycetota bacterium]